MAQSSRPQVAPDKPLTPLEAAFVREYQVDQNGTKAAIRAGASPTSAKVTASRWLTKANVVAALEAVHAMALQVVAERTEEAIGSEAWIIEKAGEVVNRALNAVPVYEMRDGMRVPVEGEWTCNLGAATPALALLAKRLSAFSDKHELEAKVGVMLVRQTRGLRNG